MAKNRFSTLIKKAKSFSLHLGVPNIGWDDALIIQTVSFLYSSQRQGVFAVDLGAGVGYSTLYIARGLAEGCSGQCRIDAVEIRVERAKVARQVLDMLREPNIEVNVVNMDAVEYLMKKREMSIDIAFVDVDKREYPEIIDLLSRKLKVGGVAMFHNALFPSPPQTFFSRASHPPWISSIVPTELGILIAIKGT